MHDAVLVRGLERGRYALLQDSDLGERQAVLNPAVS